MGITIFIAGDNLMYLTKLLSELKLKIKYPDSKMSTISIENYIKAIYQSSNPDAKISTSEMADKLEVSNAAISDMAKKLSSSGLISYKKYEGFELTEKGLKLAMQVVRRHRLWELFLTKVLGLSWSEVHQEAEKLEHHSSDDLVNKIEEYLDYPTVDPHGDPIPDREGNLPELPEFKKLIECQPGVNCKIVRVHDKNTELMNYLSRIGLTLNKKIRVLQKLSFDNSLIIKADGSEYTLSEKISDNIFVVEL